MYHVKRNIKSFTRLFIFINLLLLSWTLNVQAQSDGELDTSFSGDGKLISDPTVKDEYINDVAIQTDGKIVVAGYVDYGTYTDFLVARYNENGTTDETFGMDYNNDGRPDGYVTTNFNPPGDDTKYINKAYAVAIDRLGYIIVVGSSDVNQERHFAIAKYGPHGEPDAAFGINGILVKAIGADSEAHDIVVVDDINFLVAGYAYLDGTYEDFALAKFEANGGLDTSFGNGLCAAVPGVTCQDFGNDWDDQANALAVQSDGKIVLTGQTQQISTAPDTNVATARFDSTGLLDSSFGSNGLIVTFALDIGPGFAAAQDVMIDSSGNVVVAGYVGRINFGVFLVRYDPSGNLDNSFDGDGIVTTDWGSSIVYAPSLGINKNGNILVAGKSQNKFAVARYLTSNGRPDASFGTNGLVTTWIVGDGSAQALAIDANDKIVLAGQDKSTGTKIALARYHDIVLTDKDLDTYHAGIGDCDDNNAAIHPGAKEICGDGIDQDCNGSDLACPTFRPRFRRKF